MVHISTMNTKLLKALEIIGTHKKLSNLCGVTRQQIGKWTKGIVPVKHVLTIEKATKGKVKRYELRPDIYPKD